VSPDNAVQYEALLAGLGMRGQWGADMARVDAALAALHAAGAPAAATLRLALDMLLPDETGRQASAAIEQCVLVRAHTACGAGVVGAARSLCVARGSAGRAAARALVRR
jgi:hypothetical protein